MSIFSRTELLFGSKVMTRFAGSKVAIAGLGGVGSTAAEMLARSGIGSLTIIDFDTVGATDLNRQIIATADTIGKQKTEVLAQRLKSIDPAIEIIQYCEFCDEQNRDIIFRDTDFIVDAIDSLGPKVGLIEYAYQNRLHIISSMGAGNRIDPSKIKLADIADANGCPLVKRVKKYLRKRGIISGIPVVYSDEPPITLSEKIVNTTYRGRNRETIGSVSYLPVIIGGWVASYVLRTIAANR